MDSFQIEITGLAEVEQRLQALPEQTAKKLFTKALTAAGNVLKTEVQERTPVKVEDSGPNSNSLPPGALKDGITSTVSVQPQKGSGSVTVRPSKDTAHVARWLEFGHQLVSHKPNKKVIGNVPAIPFFRNAFDAAKDRAVDAFTESLASDLSKWEEK